MLYSEKELEKRLQSGCALYYFYASDEALVHAAAQKALKYLNRDDPETTVLDGPTPSVEEIVLAAGTISFFGGKRLVLMPLIRPSTYSDKDLQELCDTLADTENAIFVMTGVVEEAYGKLRPGKREQKLIGCCEKLGYCVQINRPTGAALQAMARDWAKEAGADFAPGAEAALLARCGEDQFLLKNEVEKLAALANYGRKPTLHFADRAVQPATGAAVWQYEPAFTEIPGGEAVFGPIRDGMKRMAQTARALREAPVTVAAKTGSPQLADTLPGGSHYVNSVLIGYAPADDPQIAMAVVLEYGGGGANAAPVMRAVLDAWFE